MAPKLKSSQCPSSSRRRRKKDAQVMEDLFNTFDETFDKINNATLQRFQDLKNSIDKFAKRLHSTSHTKMCHKTRRPSSIKNKQSSHPMVSTSSATTIMAPTWQDEDLPHKDTNELEAQIQTTTLQDGGRQGPIYDVGLSLAPDNTMSLLPPLL